MHHSIGTAMQVDGGFLNRTAVMPSINYEDYNGKNIFESKVALSSAYRFSGKDDDGAMWRQHARAYFATKCTVISQLLDWAESR